MFILRGERKTIKKTNLDSLVHKETFAFRSRQNAFENRPEMPRRGTFAVLSIAALLICVAAASYRLKREDDVSEASRDASIWRSAEDAALRSSGVCENRSGVGTCRRSTDPVPSLLALKSAECFCDEECRRFGDCCLDYAAMREPEVRGWTCRELRGERFYVPVYVWSACPDDWGDPRVRTLCETEATDLESQNLTYSHLQDVPVKSEGTSGVFYRNVFCAVCNGEIRLVRWNTTIRCSGVPGVLSRLKSESAWDFSSVVYDTRTQSFKNVEVLGVKTSCRMQIHDFRFQDLVGTHSARLCKPFVDTCSGLVDKETSRKCQSYASFVYTNGFPDRRRTVYKNFHCALCNGVDVKKIYCDDPWNPFIFTTSRTGASLSFLFDFNFEGDNNQIGVYHPCKLGDGFIWDRVLKKCTSFTCGALFEWKNGKCVPKPGVDPKDGLNSSCYKSIIFDDSFTLYRNKSVYINRTGKLLPPEEYEIIERRGDKVISIGVCVEEGSYLLHLSQIHYWVAEVTLSLSVICLVFHLLVYGLLKDLQNCPGKILMSLSTCLILGHVFLLAGKFVKDHYLMCYVCGAVAHFGYLSSFLWMNVMAFDIYRTFSMTKSRGSKSNTFIKYSIYSWTCSTFILTFSIIYDNTIPPDNEFRPKYGDPICWFNQRKGLIVFFVLPIFVLLLKNVIFFTITAFNIRKISKEAKMAKNFSDKERFLLHIKLTVVFGLTWLLGILAGIFRASFLWYLFILFNGLQGVFIFVAFTVKRKIYKMLRVRLKLNSHSYEMGRQSALKRALYSSLSNLTTITSQLPPLDEDRDILKAVRKINTDL